MDGLAEIVLDCTRAAAQAKFWATALGWRVRAYDDAEIARLAALGLTPQTDPSVAVDAPDHSLVLFCTTVPEQKTVKNRMHVDVRIRDKDHFAELLEMGARILSEHERWIVMADPEGNEFCAVGSFIRSLLGRRSG